MFHRPSKPTSDSSTTASSVLKDNTGNMSASETAQDAPVMKSPASFMQSQQVKETPSTNTETSEKEETKIMENKDENIESKAEIAQSVSRAPAAGFAGTNSGMSYNSTPSYGSSASTSSSYDRDTGRKLVVGEGINMSGEIDSCDHLIVEGTVEAALKGAAILDIYDKGTFFGTVEIQEATIAGKFEGDLVVHGRLTIRAGGEVSGTIAYGELAIEAGAQMQGMIRPTSAMAEETKAPVKKKTAKKLKAANTAAQEADTELPFAADAATA